MTPVERARRFKQEADEVIKMVHLKRHCARIGKIIPTGSYFLNLMMYPDIDLYVPYTIIEYILELATKLAIYDCVKEIVFQKGGRTERPELAKGYYLKPIINHGEWGRPWKIDIWSLPGTIIDEKQAVLQDLKERMTRSQRKSILEYKHSILTEKGRTPMFSGIFIYRAVIDHGMTDFNEITKYLKENGIKM